MASGLETTALPKAFLDKIDAADSVQPVLAAHDEALAEYCSKAVNFCRDRRPTSPELTGLEHQNMKKIVAMENARHPGLNLVYMGAQRTDLLVEQISAAIKLQSSRFGFSGSSTYRFIFPPTALSIHRSLAEVQVTKSTASITIFDSFLPVTDMQMKIPKDMLETAGWKVSFVVPQIQTSNQDCITFALSFALKSFKTKFGESINDMETAQVVDKNTRRVIPPDFFKHTQDPDVPEHVGKVVDKSGTQTLGDRIKAYQATRIANSGDKQTVSTSIEAFRLQEIRRVSEAFQKGEREGFDDVSAKLCGLHGTKETTPQSVLSSLTASAKTVKSVFSKRISFQRSSKGSLTP